MFEGNCKLINFNMKLVVNNTIVVVRIALIKIYLVFNVIVWAKKSWLSILGQRKTFINSRDMIIKYLYLICFVKQLFLPTYRNLKLELMIQLLKSEKEVSFSMLCNYCRP